MSVLIYLFSAGASILFHYALLDFFDSDRVGKIMTQLIPERLIKDRSDLPVISYFLVCSICSLFLIATSIVPYHGRMFAIHISVAVVLPLAFALIDYNKDYKWMEQNH